MNSNTPIFAPTQQKTLWWFLWRLLWALMAVLLLLLIVLYTAMGTRTGTAFILDKIAQEANIELQYREGDLRNGLWVSDITMAIDDDIRVEVNRAYVKMGWRAIFAKQIHLVKADIDTITITDNKAPTNEPFDYPTLALPITLITEHTTVNHFAYNKKDTAPVRLHHLAIKKATWSDTTIHLTDGNLTVDEYVTITEATGKIHLNNDYPLSAKAKVKVSALEAHHFDVFEVDAHGTLRRTVGQLRGQYNHAPITGEVIVQGMDEGIPFWANVHYDKITLPYANEQNIVLSDGTLHATGIVSDIKLKLNTHMTGKDIPDGRYHGRLSVNNDGLNIDRLFAQAQAGDLWATGRLDWSNDFYMDTKIYGTNFNIHQAIPKDYADFQAYAPNILDGHLDFAFGTKDQDDNTWFKLGITQNDGETIHAHLTQKNQSAQDKRKSDKSPPWYIHANWQNLKRHNLPNLGELHSPSGQAKIILDDNIAIYANAHLVKLSVLPKGDYQADIIIKDKDIDIKKAIYQGIAGDLNAQGMVYLPTKSRPLSWHIHGKTQALRPNDYFANMGDPTRTPIKHLLGHFITTGRLRDDGDDKVLDISLKDSDITAVLDNHQQIGLTGQTQVNLRLGDTLERFHAKIEGNLHTQGINAALANNQINLVATGDLHTIDISKLTLSGKAGYLSVAGKVDRRDGITWRANARADKLDTSVFHKQGFAILTGDIYSQGQYKNNQLIAMQTDINAHVVSQKDNLPSGHINADISGNNHQYTIHKLSYDGIAGTLAVQGFVDITQGIRANMDAQMNGFDLGQFIKNRPSNLSGKLSALVDWQNDEQRIDLKTLNIQGHINDERLLMQGKLQATFDLPKNLGAYFADIKKEAKAKFDLDKLTGGFQTSFGQGVSQFGYEANQLQQNIAKQDADFRRIIKKLVADNIMLVFGDNRLDIDGNENKLSANINAPMISQVFPTIRGSIVGGVILEGNDHRLPTLYTDLKLNNISMPAFAVRKAEILGRVVNLAYQDSALVIEADSLIALGKTFRRVRADLFGTQGNHDIRLTASNNELQMGLRLQGGLDGNRYQGVLSEGRLQTRMGVLNQKKPTEMTYQLDTGTLQMAAHCWQTLSAAAQTQTTKDSLGALCLTDNLLLGANHGNVHLDITNLDTAVFTPILPSDLSWRSRLNGNVQASWGNDTPNIHVALYSDNGIVGLRSEGLPDTTLPYHRISLIAHSVPAGLKVRTDIQAAQGGGYVDVLIDPYKENKPISGALLLEDVNLNVLRPFFPAIQTLSGVINLAGGMGGTLTKPLIYGKANLSKGQLSLVDVPIALSDIDLAMNIQGTKATLAGDFLAGTGKGKLTGELDWHHDIQAKFNTTGDELVISSPPLLSAKVSPDVEVVIRPKQKYVNVQGVVSIPHAIIRPPEGTHHVIGQSGDVTVIDRRTTGNIDNLLASVAPWSINANLGVDLGNDVVFRGFGAKLPLAGALHLTQSGQGKLAAQGVIEVSERAKVDIIGQNLELNYAQVRFHGDILNPRLSVEGVRQIEGKTVGVRISDRLDKPNIQVFNDAGLSEQQAMNALVTGSLSESSGTQITEQNIRSQVTNSLAAAGLRLGLQSTRGITNQIGNALGLESLTVDASGSAANTNINVTGYITPDLYIRYGVGVFNAESTLSARYQLTRRVYIEAASGTERMIDLVYRRRFK